VITYIKFLTAEGKGAYSDKPWHLPEGDKPGKWMPKVKRLVLCESGYHVCDRDHVLPWLNEAMYEVEIDGDRLYGGDKLDVQRARLLRRVESWNPQTARLFAADCAAFALRFVATPDPRSVAAIETARRYAHGQATDDELRAARAAARAAWDAAGAAAWATAGAAGAAAWAARAAWDAAWDARAAAGDALTLRFWQYVESETIPEPWPIGFGSASHNETADLILLIGKALVSAKGETQA